MLTWMGTLLSHFWSVCPFWGKTKSMFQESKTFRLKMQVNVRKKKTVGISLSVSVNSKRTWSINPLINELKSHQLFALYGQLLITLADNRPCYEKKASSKQLQCDNRPTRQVGLLLCLSFDVSFFCHVFLLLCRSYVTDPNKQVCFLL